MPAAPLEWVAAAALGVRGGLGAGRGATAGITVTTVALGAIVALAIARTAAAEALPGATVAEFPGVGGAAEAEGKGG